MGPSTDVARPRNLDWKRAAALLYGDWGTSYDPGKYEDMSLLEKFFVKYDRGRSIRFEREYASLISQVFYRYQAYSPYLTYYKSRNIVFECFND